MRTLHDFRAAHANVFAGLEHAQQPCLCGKGQFAHLVEEDGASVGDAEVAFALADGTGERAFLVSEEFAVDGAFGDGAAVDGKIFLAPAGRVVVDDAGYDFFSHAALAHDEHAEVGRCHLQGNVERAVQAVAVADNVIALFYFLQFGCVHWVTKLHIFPETSAILSVFYVLFKVGGLGGCDLPRVNKPFKC